MVDRDLWERFKATVGVEGGLRRLGEAVEDAIREDLCDVAMAGALEGMLSGRRLPGRVRPVKPRVETDAGTTLREVRGSGN